MRSDIPDRVQRAAWCLAIDATTADVVRLLAGADVRVVLLKGATTVRWLYAATDERIYRDVDLLVAPDQYAVAEGVLADARFRSAHVGMASQEMTPMHAQWVSSTGVLVELHRSFYGIGAPDVHAWTELTRAAETITIAGEVIEMPALSTRSLLVALHASQHGKDERQPLQDLERACDQVPFDVWRDAAAVAEKVEATAAMAAGLRLVPAGRVIADELGLPHAASVELLMRVRAAPSYSHSLEGAAQAAGIARVRYIARKLLPSTAFMRYRYGLADAGAIRLALAYPVRWWHFLAALGPSVKAWTRIRREARRLGSGTRRRNT